MLWNFQNFTIKFINGEWWQQKQTNPQNIINEYFLSWLGYSKNKQITWNLGLVTWVKTYSGDAVCLQIMEILHLP